MIGPHPWNEKTLLRVLAGMRGAYHPTWDSPQHQPPQQQPTAPPPPALPPPPQQQQVWHGTSQLRLICSPPLQAKEDVWQAKGSIPTPCAFNVQHAQAGPGLQTWALGFLFIIAQKPSCGVSHGDGWMEKRHEIGYKICETEYDL